MLRSILPALMLFALPLAGCGNNDDPVEQSQAAAAGLGPAIGSLAPDIRLLDANGTERTLADLAGENGSVVFFNRSLDWCPYCQRQALEVEDAADAFDARGYGLVFITYDPVDDLAMFSERQGVSIVLLSDENSATIDAFELRDPMYSDPDHYAYGVPYPIAFVLNTDGIVQAKFWHEPGFGQDGGYQIRIDVNDVLNAIDAL